MDLLEAGVAIPAEAVEGPLGALLLDHEADGSRGALGRVGDALGQEVDLAFADHEVLGLAGGRVDDPENDVSLDLIEELFGLLDVVIVTGVGAADDHHDRLALVDPHGLVADGGLEQVPVIGDPLLEVEGSEHRRPPRERAH